MSRTEEVWRLTERVYKSIIEQFNPALRNFILMGRNYDTALTGVNCASRDYFDALVKLGELASLSQGSKELGDTLFQMAEVYRQIQGHMEETLRLFRADLLNELGHKLELDMKFLASTLKSAQSDVRNKSNAIEKCCCQIRKYRRKGQKNPQKYREKEVELVQTLSHQQQELEAVTAEYYTVALREERRRYCLLVNRQCAVSQHFQLYHSKVRDMLLRKLPSWLSACADPDQIPDRAALLVKDFGHISPQLPPAPCDPDVPSEDHLTSGSQSLPLPQAVLRQRAAPRETQPIDPGATGGGSGTPAPAQDPDGLPPPPPSPADTPSCPLPLPPQELLPPPPADVETTLPEPDPSPTPVPRRVRTQFPHHAGGDPALLSFREGEVIVLLLDESRGGWEYGESEYTGRRGWFPTSYTTPIPEDSRGAPVNASPQLSKTLSSSTSRLGEAARRADVETPPARTNAPRPRPFSLMNPDLRQEPEMRDPRRPSPSNNPFANVSLRRTVTNDRSAPLIR